MGSVSDGGDERGNNNFREAAYHSSNQKLTKNDEREYNKEERGDSHSVNFQFSAQREVPSWQMQ